jgi:hypothetical protein
MKIILPFVFLLFSANQPRPAKIKANSGMYGKYNEFSLAVYNDSVTGAYQYYDKWNEKNKEFTDINVFYFQGRIVSDSMASINAGWLGQTMTGKIIFSRDSSITVFLSDEPEGYNTVSFTSKKGVTMKLKKGMVWKKIDVIREKTRLFDAPDSSSIRKGYLIKNDIIKVRSKKNNWEEIDYSNTGDLERNDRYWIRL